MKITKRDDGTFQMEMTPDDANEAQLQACLKTIIALAREIEKRGAAPDQRKSERGGHYRYSEAERSLMLIRDNAAEALRHIKWLDFPDAQTDAAQGGSFQ